VALAAALAGSALTGLLAVSSAGAQAPPVQFFGSITINGSAAPVAGTTVTASAEDGTVCATAVNGGAPPNVIEASGGETIYGVQVQVQGVADEDPCTFSQSEGDVVVFSVNGVQAATVNFASTPPLQEVDLSITEATETPTSEPTDTPTSTVTGTPTATGTTPPAGTATPKPPDTGFGGSDEGANLGLIIGLAVAAAAALSASGYVLARRSSR
jgi:hypothetical protein